MYQANKSNLLTTVNCQEHSRDEIITIRNLSVSYTIGNIRNDVKSRALDILLRRNFNEQIWALHDINLSCYPKEIIGIIGSNGAGKTTLCRVISGLLKPDEGNIKIGGTVSALFSLGTGFRHHLSGRENVFLNGMMLGFSRRQVSEIVQEVIEFSELSEFIDQPLKYYSSGMKARLGFSIAAMMQPEILVLDEALSTGDLKFSEKAGAKLREIIEKAKLVIVVTHKMGFVKKYCSRALWLDKGTIFQDGAPDDILGKYMAASGVNPKKKREIQFQKTLSSDRSKILVNIQNVGIRYTLEESGNAQFNKNLFKLGRSAPKRRNLWALKDITFSVMEGEVLGIIGSNAAGKSTLCKTLCGILKPDTGSVSVIGQITALLTFGAGFKLELSGRDNIYLNGLMLGLNKKEIDALFFEIVSFSGVQQKFIYQPVKNYSNGMRARLGFSAASMIKPDVFIIDEALNAGDIAFYEKASAKIQELIAESKATLVVTHNIQFIENVCTRAILLNKGKILFDGDPHLAVSEYRRIIAQPAALSTLDQRLLNQQR